MKKELEMGMNKRVEKGVERDAEEWMRDKQG